MSVVQISSSNKAYFVSRRVVLSDEDLFEIRKMCGYKTSAVHRMIERPSLPLWGIRRKRKAK
jgi:hypothetical protein